MASRQVMASVPGVSRMKMSGLWEISTPFRGRAAKKRLENSGRTWHVPVVNDAPAIILVYIDADACPVKDEVYKVAARHGLKTFVVANSFMQIPRDPLIERVIVDGAPDAADDWIVARAGRGAIVITADVPLAARAVKAGADVIAPNGRPFSESSIGMALANRNLMQDLREAGATTGGPRPFTPRDRSTFLSALELAVVRLKRAGFLAR